MQTDYIMCSVQNVIFKPKSKSCKISSFNHHKILFELDHEAEMNKNERNTNHKMICKILFRTSLQRLEDFLKKNIKGRMRRLIKLNVNEGKTK